MEQKSMLLVVLIAALLVTVGLQTVQLAALGTSGSGSAAVVKSSATTGKAAAGSGSSAGGSLNNLPSMVGGC